MKTQKQKNKKTERHKINLCKKNKKYFYQGEERLVL